LAVKLGKDLMTMDDLKATQLQDGESSHEKSSVVVCWRKSKFFEAKVPMFKMKKSSTAPMAEWTTRRGSLRTNKILLQYRVSHRQCSRKI
jgi:hypothetical protein